MMTVSHRRKEVCHPRMSKCGYQPSTAQTKFWPAREHQGRFRISCYFPRYHFTASCALPPRHCVSPIARPSRRYARSPEPDAETRTSAIDSFIGARADARPLSRAAPRRPTPPHQLCRPAYTAPHRSAPRHTALLRTNRRGLRRRVSVVLLSCARERLRQCRCYLAR